jgi:hypothetical protein
MGSDPDSGIGCPELSDSGGSGGSHQRGRLLAGCGAVGGSLDHGRGVGGAHQANLHHHPAPLRTFSQPEEAAPPPDHHHHVCHHHHGGIAKSASRDLWTEDRLGRPQPLKGILKNGQFSTLPAGCSCSTRPAPLSQANLLLFNEQAAKKTATVDRKEKLRKDEVLDTVESSV